MQKIPVWVFSVGGVIGLLFALGFHGSSGPNGAEFHMGYPDSWVVWESTPNSHHSEVNFFRWSVLILVASIWALSHAARLSRRKPVDAQPTAAGDRGG